jgi:tetratricopeptide (TPR) repeat protein
MVKIMQKSYLLLISVSLLHILMSISCSTRSVTQESQAAVSQRPLSQLKITKVDKESGNTLNYIFYLDDENVEVQLSDKNNDKKRSQGKSAKQITQEIELKEAKLRRKLKAEYSKKLNRSIRNVTENYTKAQAYYSKKQYKQAIKFINKALAYGSHSPTVLSLAGSIYYASGNISAAIKQWKKALRADSSLVQVKKMLRVAKKQHKAKKR